MTTMDARLLDILVCPICKGPLRFDKEHQTLDCKADHLAFPIRDGIPVMLETEAVPLDAKQTPVPGPGLTPPPVPAA